MQLHLRIMYHIKQFRLASTMDAAKSKDDPAKKKQTKQQRAEQLQKAKDAMAKVHEKLEQSARIRRRFVSLGRLVVWKDERSVGQLNMFHIALNHELMMLVGEPWVRCYPDKATSLSIDISRYVIEKFYFYMGKQEDIIGMSVDSSGVKKLFNHGMRYRFQGEKTGHRVTCSF